MEECDYIYDPKLLETLDFDENHIASYNPKISLLNPGPNLVVRPLSWKDYDKGYFKLPTLSERRYISRQQFQERWRLMVSCPNSYYITVIEDTKTTQVIGTSTLHVEYKFHGNLGLRGRIQDILIGESYRDRQLDKLLVDVANLICRTVGFYKVSSHGEEQMMPFYRKLGYIPDDTRRRMTLKPDYL